MDLYKNKAFLLSPSYQSLPLSSVQIFWTYTGNFLSDHTPLLKHRVLLNHPIFSNPTSPLEQLTCLQCCLFLRTFCVSPFICDYFSLSDNFLLTHTFCSKTRQPERFVLSFRQSLIQMFSISITNH